MTGDRHFIKTNTMTAILSKINTMTAIFLTITTMGAILHKILPWPPFYYGCYFSTNNYHDRHASK